MRMNIYTLNSSRMNENEYIYPLYSRRMNVYISLF